MTEYRDEYIAGLRAMADLLESTQELPLPEPVEFEWNVWGHVSDTPVPAEVARIAKLLPGKLAKNDPASGDYDQRYYTLTGAIGGLATQVCAYRAKVCERVVTGTQTVTKTVPVTTREVTETVDVVEWVCKPILAEATR